MSSAEWNVLGLLMSMSGVLMLLRFGLPSRLRPESGGALNYLGLVLFVVGTLCQIWASVRWVG